MRIFSVALKWLAKVPSDILAYSELIDIMSSVTRVVSFLGGREVSELQSGEPIKEDMKVRAWGESFPVESAWQPEGFKPLSLRAYNLCVGCNVSVFSGWEKEEFTFRLLKRRFGDRFFGVHIHDGMVSGCLRPSHEKEIGAQWQDLKGLLPGLPPLEIESQLSKVQQFEWYKAGQKHFDQVEASASEFEQLGEDDGIQIFLAYSRLCLNVAKCCDNDRSSILHQAIQASLSILLPVVSFECSHSCPVLSESRNTLSDRDLIIFIQTQFALNLKMWDSDIGEAANSLSGFESWRNSTSLSAEPTAPEELPPSKKPGFKRSTVSKKPVEKKVKEWIEGPDKPALQSIVVIPVPALLSMWNEVSVGSAQEVKSKTSKALMKNVHSCMEKLRQCRTDTSVEKASLQVATALLELSEDQSCHNPFVTLQQAAVYASQASKGGNSDTYFRRPIPIDTECSPHQALIILGRADCLHCLYFPNEAAFLCNFVGKVCRLYRDTPGWNARWKVVAIYAYNVSVMIRSTVNTVLDKDAKKSFLHTWDREVVEELEKARSDALEWKQRNQSMGNAGGEDNDAEDFEEDSASEDHQDVGRSNDTALMDVGMFNVPAASGADSLEYPLGGRNASGKANIDPEDSFDDIEAVAI